MSRKTCAEVVNMNELAFPFGGNPVHQQGGSGLTKFELACIKLMAASVCANDHARPDYITEELAKEHAQNAVKLARSLFAELERERGWPMTKELKQKRDELEEKLSVAVEALEGILDRRECSYCGYCAACGGGVADLKDYVNEALKKIRK